LRGRVVRCDVTTAPAHAVPYPAAPAGFASCGQDDADVALTRGLADMLRHDRRTERLDLALAVRGRVAHVRGEVESEEQRQLLRALLRRVSGTRATWDLLALPGETLRVADIGCGATKQVSDAIGVDKEPIHGVDVVADLETGLPFDSASLDHVFAIHVLEHLSDLLGVMRELHRVLRPTGVLHVLTPHWRDVNAVADPTHCRLMDVRTLEYFCSPGPGVPPWRALQTATWRSTVHADMQPVAKAGDDVNAASVPAPAG
jgi:SAM-dependent methyltransferase